MTHGEAVADQILAELNTAIPGGVPTATRVVDADLEPADALAIRVLMVREQRWRPMGGRVLTKVVRSVGIECWAKSNGTEPADALADALVEHVLTKLEASNLNGLAHWTGAPEQGAGVEIVWTYITRDASWCRATVILPVQFHTKVGVPT